MIGALILKTMMDSGTNVMNQRDVSKILAHWADDAVLIFPGTMSVSGRIEGKEAIKEFFTKYMEQFPKLHFSIKNTYIKNMFAVGFSNTVASEFECVYTNQKGETFENSGVSVIQIKRGKVVKLQDYYFDTEKLKHAWGE